MYIAEFQGQQHALTSIGFRRDDPAADVFFEFDPPVVWSGSGLGTLTVWLADHTAQRASQEVVCVGGDLRKATSSDRAFALAARGMMPRVVSYLPPNGGPTIQVGIARGRNPKPSVAAADTCPDCHGSGRIELFTSSGPCTACSGSGRK